MLGGRKKRRGKERMRNAAAFIRGMEGCTALKIKVDRCLE